MERSPSTATTSFSSPTNDAVLNSTTTTDIRRSVGMVENDEKECSDMEISSNSDESHDSSVSAPVEMVVLDPLSPRSQNLKRIEQMEDKFEDGYDSDGYLPWYAVEETEGPQVFEEEEGLVPEDAPNPHPRTTSNIDENSTDNNTAVVTVDSNNTTTTTTTNENIIPTNNTTSTPTPPPPNIHVPIADDVLEKLQVKEIKTELRKRKLGTLSGNRRVLLDRLIKGLKDKVHLGLARH